ncbi:GGDEF/EAL domain-containing response regulator [Massilia sp. PWRC2]|uniref:GGDEF/EAL domain-containing response regulator n=1 Tax=Massilia sp. PWRC2 TaxID=2804626 RepID=UPI003CEF8F41
MSAPLPPMVTAATAAYSASATVAALAAPHETDILVVEDSATQARYLAQILQQAGFRVRVAGNGREGLAAARASTPTLIVSDISMPEMDGFTLCQEVKQDPQLHEVPVILLTSLSSLYDVIRGLDCGAANFLRKPFDSHYLIGRIRYILANRAQRASERVQSGMSINLGGQTHFITAERQQIFDMLIATYEEAIQMTEQLKVQQLRISTSYRSLEGLYRIAEALNPVLTEPAVGELALDRLLDFPGVLGASIRVCDLDGQLRNLATRCVEGRSSAPPPAAASCAHCERLLMAGTVTGPALMAACTHTPWPHACIALSSGAGTRGVLCLMTVDSRLGDEQWQLLSTVGSQIAVAIERARLYDCMETQVKERTAAWQGERKLLSAVVNTSGALVCMLDGDGIIRLFNPACEAALGWTAHEAIGRHCGEVLRNDDAKDGGLVGLCDSPPAHGGPTQFSGHWHARDGAVRAIIWSATWLCRPDGSVEYFVCTGVDVTALRGAEEKLRYMSRFDALTGLPNRLEMRDRVRQLQQHEAVVAGQQQVGLLLIKPERLRVIAESLGLDAEQTMLRQAAARLGHRQRNEVCVGRVSERTFAIAMTGQVDDVAGMARQVLAELSLPFLLGGQELHLDAAIGIALYPNDGDDYDAIYQGADAAMRRAMSSKNERYEFYRPSLNQDVQVRFQFENALRGAVERHELVLHYQVQASVHSGAIIGAEALVRWQHPEQGLLGPGLFIPLAEENGMILGIGEWVLRSACEQAVAWQRQGLAPVPVSVNLSARQFSEHVVAMVERILAETGLAGRLLELELTESASMEDPEKTIDILRQLKAMGVKVAIDDFGTGYSNLSYLKRFPLDKLKLDQSFVRDITSDQHDLSIARAVIAVGHGLGLTVIAEGVETAAQLDLLAANGVDEIQGYYLSRPIDGAACAALMAAHLTGLIRR